MSFHIDKVLVKLINKFVSYKTVGNFLNAGFYIDVSTHICEHYETKKIYSDGEEIDKKYIDIYEYAKNNVCNTWYISTAAMRSLFRIEPITRY